MFNRIDSGRGPYSGGSPYRENYEEPFESDIEMDEWELEELTRDLQEALVHCDKAKPNNLYYNVIIAKIEDKTEQLQNDGNCFHLNTKKK